MTFNGLRLLNVAHQFSYLSVIPGESSTTKTTELGHTSISQRTSNKLNLPKPKEDFLILSNLTEIFLKFFLFFFFVLSTPTILSANDRFYYLKKSSY